MTEATKTSRWWLLPVALIVLYCLVMATTAVRSDRRDERRLRIDSAFTVAKQRNDSLLTITRIWSDSIYATKPPREAP